MKRTTLLATLLTFLSFLLVLSATLIFTWQSRQSLRRDLAHGSATRESLSELLWEAESTQLAQNELLATVASQGTAVAEADRQAHAATLAAVGTREAGLAAALAGAQATQTAQAETVPVVRFAAPREGADVPAEEAVSVIVSAADPAGITSLRVTVDGAVIVSETPEGETLVTVQAVWVPPEPGGYLLEAMATNDLGRSSEPVTLTVSVLPAGVDPNATLRKRIEQNVVAIRGLVPKRPVTPTLLSAAALRARIVEDLADFTAEEARDDALVLSAFDFVAPDIDLHALYTEFYSEEILGFYDAETDEFVVVSDDDGLDAGEQWTHAHEYVHALQDQYYSLDGLDDEALGSEATAALRALAEGDATLTQLLYFTGGYFTPAEQAQVEASLREATSQSRVALPPVLERSFAFPYEAGLEFVMALYQQGGYPAIDAVWQDPPLSTEQILHPERYTARDLPQIVTLPPLTGTLGLDWRLLDEDVLGEFFVREYLDQALSRSEAAAAATGWGGDRYAVYWQESAEALVMVLRLVWDTPADAEEFATHYEQYAATMADDPASAPPGLRCWKGELTICLHHAGAQTHVLRLPDPAYADLLVGPLEIDASDG
jgi:hypothetical protein